MQPVTCAYCAELDSTDLFFCCIMRCRCLHGVAVLKSKIFHKRVNVYGIVLINSS